MTAWEQRKLNEYLETSREKNESCHFGKDDVLSVSGDYGIVNQIEFQGRSYAGTSVANYGVVHKGDVVYTKSPLRINPYGIIKTNRGNDGIVSTLYAVYHPTEKTHPDFVQVYFEQNARMNNYMAPLVSKGAKNDMKVSAENALKGAVTFPGIKEQEVIASYFSQLDDLITLHQRKCQYRSLYGYLSWEQRKLGGLFFESNERSSSMEILSVSVAKGIYPASESNRDTNPGASLANYKVVHKGDVVYNSMRMWQGAVGSSDYDGIVSPAYVVARPIIELDSTCFGYLLKRPEMLYKYLCDSQGNSKDTQTLKYNRFADIEVTMPVNLEEQRVISACLGRVDTLITLHQRKCQYRSLYGYLSWEQRKFSEIVDVCSGRDYKHLNEGPIPVYGTGGYMTSVCEALSHNRDAVGIGRKGTIDKPYLLKAPFWTVDTLFYAIPKPDINLEFALCSFLNVDWKSKDESTGLPSLSKEAINETVLRVPNAVEQNHLGSFFTDLDSLITLHQ